MLFWLIVYSYVVTCLINPLFLFYSSKNLVVRKYALKIWFIGGIWNLCSRFDPKHLDILVKFRIRYPYLYLDSWNQNKIIGHSAHLAVNSLGDLLGSKGFDNKKNYFNKKNTLWENGVDKRISYSIANVHWRIQCR